MSAALLATAAVIGALASFVVACTGLIVAVSTNHKATVNAVQVAEVHQLVNSQLSAQITRGDRAEEALEQHGIEIPSVEPT